MTEAGPPSAGESTATASAGDSSSETTLEKLKAALSPSWPAPAVAIVIALCPLIYCLLRGAMGASLWLDEILYLHFERHPEIRSIAWGRPGSFWPRLIGPFAYADLQRAVHAFFDLCGFHLSTNPELYLRLPSLIYFAIAVVALYFISLRAGADKLWAAGVALAFGSTPAFLFYAFEARVYSLGALLVIAFLAVLWEILCGARGWTLAVGTALGLTVALAHLWDVCLLAAIGLCLPFLIWRDSEHWRKGFRVALVVSLGSIWVLIQAAYVFSMRMPSSSHAVPVFDPQPIRALIFSTVYGPFLGLLRGDPEYILGILLAIAILRGRGKLGWYLPACVVISLALSVVLIHKYGWGVSPRHQMPLYGGIFACLALMRGGLVSKALLANLIGLNLVLVPATVQRIHDKGNAKQIARVIGSGERLRQFPVVVQHSYALGYTDPLHTFGLALYLNGVTPGKSETPILELPTHRDVRDVMLDREYFINAREQLEVFASSPVDEWIGFLRNLPDKAVWLVAPVSSRNLVQARKYESALKAAGFSRVRGIPGDFSGYPTTRLSLWKREKDIK